MDRPFLDSLFSATTATGAQVGSGAPATGSGRPSLRKTALGTPGRCRSGSRERLVGVLGQAIVDDIEIEIAVLVEVEPASHKR